MKMKKYKWIIFYTTVAGTFLAILDGTTVNIALFKIAQDFALKMTQVQWVYIAYMLVLTIFLPFFGKLGDIFQRNKVYAAGYLLFGLGAFLNFTAHNFYLLIIYRCIEALGGSILLSNANAIISSVFRGEKRAKIMGINGAIIALGGMSGPVIGGVLMNLFGWNHIFLIHVPFAIAGAFLAYKTIPSFRVTRMFEFDYAGFLLFTLFLSCMLVCIAQGHTWGWLSPVILSIASLAVVCGILFYLREHHIQYPLIDFKMFKNRTILWGNIALITCYGAMFSSNILFPFFAQDIMEFNPLRTALLMLPFSVTVAVMAPLVGIMAAKFGSKYLTCLGAATIAAALLIFATLRGNSSLAVIVIAHALLGGGSALFQAPANVAIMEATNKHDFGISSGLMALSRNFGTMTGIGLAVTVFDMVKSFYVKNNMLYDLAFVKSYHITLYFGVLFALICAVISCFAFKKNKEQVF